MAAARSALFLLLLVLSVVCYGSILIVLGRLLAVRTRARIARNWARLVLWLLRVTCGLGVEVRGLENLPKQPGIVLCKHQSAWETIALRALLPLDQTWVLKKQLMRIPVFGGALARFDPIAIDRAAGRQAIRQLLEQGAQQLQKGRWIIIFPEGTRVAPGETHHFGIGGALLAERTGATVVPIAHNAGVYWRRRALRKHSGCIRLVIGPPIETLGKKAQQINTEAATWINATVDALPGDRARDGERLLSRC
jgi:1-acyl-sn-glycerol-3-phosphate acyltransferase